MKRLQILQGLAVTVLYAVAGIILSYAISMELCSDRTVSNWDRAGWTLLFVCVLTLAVVIVKKSTSNHQIRHAAMKSYTCGLLFYYLFGVLGLLFFSKDLAHYNQMADSEEYMEQYVSLIPFETYQQMFSQYHDDVLALRDSVILFAGRMAAFLPLGLLLLVLIRALRHFWRYSLVMCGAIFLVEAFQLMLRLGSVTIDGIMLNVLGAEFAYLAFWNPWIQRFLKKFEFIQT